MITNNEWIETNGSIQRSGLDGETAGLLLSKPYGCHGDCAPATKTSRLPQRLFPATRRLRTYHGDCGTATKTSRLPWRVCGCHEDCAPATETARLPQRLSAYSEKTPSIVNHWLTIPISISTKVSILSLSQVGPGFGLRAV